MRNLFFLLILFLISNHANSQDEGIGLTGDTIKIELLSQDSLLIFDEVKITYKEVNYAYEKPNTIQPNIIYQSHNENTTETDYRFLFGCNIGVSCSYSDHTFNFSFPLSFSLDMHLKKGYYLQTAPKYSLLFKWNEHYLTLPLHIRKQFGNRISLFVGPAITWDLGHFKDLGISGGAYFHFSKGSSLILSAFTFTLFDYYIDYKYIPVGISYNYYLNNHFQKRIQKLKNRKVDDSF